MNQLTVIAKAWIALVIVTGAAVVGYLASSWKLADPLRFMVLAALAVAASRLRVKLPGMRGVMGMNLPFLLIAIVQLGISEAVVIASFCGLIQSFSRTANIKPVQMIFNAATLVNAVAVAALFFGAFLKSTLPLPLAVIATALMYFVANTIPIAVVLWLAEDHNPLRAWFSMASLSLPYYLLSAAMAGILASGIMNGRWIPATALFVTMYAIYRSYRIYFAAASPTNIGP